MNTGWKYRFGELIEDWKFYLKMYPWRYSISTILKEFMQLPYLHIHYLIYSRSLAEPFPELYSDVSIVIRRFAQQDLPEVAKINRPSEATLCAKHFADEHEGVAALCEDQLVGYSWAYTKFNPTIDKFDFKLEPLDFLCNDAFTSPNFRGRSIQPTLLLTHFRIFHEMGFQRAFGYIDQRNRSSIRVWEKLGGYCIGNIEYVRIGPKRRVKQTLHTSPKVE